MLRKSTPMRGPYKPGDLVSFIKKGKWYGPCRVISNEGRSSLWLLHSGVCVLVAESACRPATSQEVLKKQVLELRLKPSRKRKRELFGEVEDDEDMIPFQDDLTEAKRIRESGQAPYVDLHMDTLEFPGVPGVAVSPGDGAMEPTVEATVPAQLLPTSDVEYSPTELAETPEGYDPNLEYDFGNPPGLEPGDLGGLHQPVPPSTPSSTLGSLNSQPEREATPELRAPQPTNATPESSTMTPLTQALRRDLGALDGLPARRQAQFSEEMDETPWQCFVLSRQVKKYKNQKRNQKVGAGRELVFSKETPEVRLGLIETREKEWSNWMKYANGKLIDDQMLKKLRKDQPWLRVIPTRWVDVDKAEVGQTMRLKSRLVVRGDLEDATNMRTDPPTSSQTMMTLVLILSACRDTILWAGGISAAFLQGAKMDRILILSLPKDGAPEPECEGKYYMVSTTVYGTKDAPRGWFKVLDEEVKAECMKPIPFEPASYSLQDDDGNLSGLLIAHVDDLMWTGGAHMERVMEKICQRFNFGKLEKDNFRYCGRDVSREKDGIRVTCDSLIDRVRPIYLDIGKKKSPHAHVTEKVRGQLRSVVGSLAWLARVCRPDLSFGVCHLQSCVHDATYAEIKFANSLVALAKRQKGMVCFISKTCVVLKI